ncbi:DUF4157 domain-containing protein [uncultured Treponema sp.]|uniref:eCIS core domain-containing protein n=1 Tax=uncultured Treponema sp. TaxID=162155 RepID=UPI00258FF4DE|nr:DUF4157 domain-containing protein [uncultured Treponema sp.]
MECNSSTKKIFSFVTKAGERRKTRKSSTPSQIIPLDEQTKNDFELRHDTKLKNTMIYFDPDYKFILSPALLAFAVENRIHIRKSKYNPGSTETDQIIEHELTHVQQYSEGRDNESVDELELEATLNETRHLRNGEEVKYIEYASGKYCQTTISEYKRLLADIADDFESKVWSKINMLSEEKQLELLIELEEWSKRNDLDEYFDIERWY